jgi:hypothetical protein
LPTRSESVIAIVLLVVPVAAGLPAPRHSGWPVVQVQRSSRTGSARVRVEEPTHGALTWANVIQSVFYGAKPLDEHEGHGRETRYRRFILSSTPLRQDGREGAR